MQGQSLRRPRVVNDLLHESEAPVLALKEAFALVRALASRLREAGGSLVTVTRMDGSFGLGSSLYRPGISLDELADKARGLVAAARTAFPAG